jgi:hypothetical protein
MMNPSRKGRKPQAFSAVRQLDENDSYQGTASAVPTAKQKRTALAAELC